MLELKFLQYCLDENVPLPEGVKEINWLSMLAFAEQQAIIGVVFQGIQKAGKDLSMPFNVLVKWIGYASKIETQNRLLNDRCVKVVKMFENAGFKCCILKGQGNALMYPNPLMRTPGDIDVLMHGKSIKETIKFAQKHNPNGKACYHHVDYGDYHGVEVEVHYRPSFMFSPKYNQRLQKWFCRIAAGGCMTAELPDGVGTIPVPTWKFNVSSQLSHIYNHVLHEGIGLRQMIDYYYLLKQRETVKLRNDGETLRHLGLEKIAGAVMWILHEVLGLEKKYLIAPVDEKRGRFLLDDIMQGGNFGHYDQRVNHGEGQFQKNITRLKRDFRFLKYFPSECLWEPIFRIYHFFWRMTH